jgi:hypothetical protein
MALLAFRWLVAACQGATLLITWPLWQVHVSPPMLPVLALPRVDMGLVLLASLALVFVRASLGVALHATLLGYAVLLDQTRIQPQIVSQALLLWGTLPSPTARAVGRAHLVALWSWAAVSKLLSPAFLTTAGFSAFFALVPTALSWVRPAGGYLMALTELGAGVLAIFPRTRRWAGTLAFILHAWIVVTMASVSWTWNQAVWPWNVALAFAGLALIAPWKEPLRQTICESPMLGRFVIIGLLVSPAGWFVGITDAYLAHHLYSGDVPRARSTALGTGATWGAFRVPLPPEHRIFEQYFRLTCKAGDELTVTDARWWFRARGLEKRRLTCPADH